MIQNLLFILRLFKKRPIRMSLMFLEIAIGVAAVTLVIGALLVVFTNSPDLQHKIFQVTKNSDITGLTTQFDLSPDIAENIGNHSNYIEHLSFVERYPDFIATHDDKQYKLNSFYGVDPGIIDVLNFSLVKGYFFQNIDLIEKNHVIVISEDVSQRLFKTENPLGQQLIINDNQNHEHTFTIIGVFSLGKLKKIELALHFLIPYTTLSDNINDLTHQTSVWFSCLEKNEHLAKEEFETLLLQDLSQSNPLIGHYTGNKYLTFTEQLWIFRQNQRYFVNNFGFFFTFIAILSVVVSSLGILSMTMISVVERTKEIGLRRTLGSTRSGIIRQVLSESIFLSLVGSICGITVASILLNPVTNQIILKGFAAQVKAVQVTLSLPLNLAVLAGSIVMGIISGLYPAILASTLTPIEAVNNNFS